MTVTHGWLTRALVAVAVPALVLPAFSSSAAAATKPPAVPTLAAVAKIYPHLEDGYADITRAKVTGTGKDCKPGDAIKGATERDAFYVPDLEQEPDDLVATGDEPFVFISAARFSSTKDAREYFASDRADSKKCMAVEGPLGPRAKVTFKKVRVDLGAESWGYQITWATKKATNVATLTTVRTGTRFVGVFTMVTDGLTAPSIPKTIALTRLAVKTAG